MSNHEQTSVARRTDFSIAKITGGNGVEVAILSFAVMCVGLAVFATIRAARSEKYNEDLSFAATLNETSSLIRNRGSDAVASYRSGMMQVGSAMIPVDSLAMTGDSTLFPSLAKGGFLRDQIELHNSYASRVAIRNLFSADSSPLGVGTPSIFRLARTDSGYQVLSSELNEYSLAVPSPRRDRQWITVRTRDGHSSPSLVGLFGTVDLNMRDSVLTNPVPLSGAECRVQRRGAARLLYCGSAAGYAVGAGFDMGFDLPDTLAFGTGTRARLSRNTALFHNGVRVAAPTPFATGDLLYTRATGAMVPSNIESGVLAGEQWLNGRTSFTTGRKGTIEQLGRIGRSASSSVASEATLGLDATLSRDLDRRVDAFMKEHADVLEDMSLVVADIGTGEVRAISQSGRRDGEPIRVFEPVLFGSLVKPIMAAAIVSQDPALAQMNIHYAGDDVTEVGGIRLSKPFRNPGNGCIEDINFAAFLRCSSNQYAAGLFIRSIERASRSTQIASNGVVPNSLLENAPITNGLLTLFDDVDVVSSRDPGRSDRIWKAADGSNAFIPRDRSVHPWKSRPWFIDARSNGTSVDLLSRFAFGGWENRWTPIGAAEAYARIATDRRVQLGMLKQNGAPGRFTVMPARAKYAFREVRVGLSQVADGGTADGIGSAYRSIAPHDSLVVLAKTGTLNEVTARKSDDDVYVKSLAVVVGQRQGTRADDPLRCGIVAVLHFQFRQDWKQRDKSGDPRLPSLHRDFAEQELATSLRNSWNRISPCRLMSI